MAATNEQHAVRLREIIADLSGGTVPNAYGPEYIAALWAGANALDPDEVTRDGSDADGDT